MQLKYRQPIYNETALEFDLESKLKPELKPELKLNTERQAKKTTLTAQWIVENDKLVCKWIVTES